MRSWSVPAGRLFGVDIRIHLTFLFLLAFVWFTQSVTMGAAGAMRGVALVAIIFGCVVLHELGHALVARHNGIGVRSIILLPIGGVTLMEDTGQRDPARDIRIAVAGPLVNLVIAAVSGAVILLVAPQVKLWAHPFVHAGNLPRALFWGNVFLGGFNLLPAYPMDGGRILRSLLALRMPMDQATRAAAGAGQTLAILMGLAGLLWGNFILMFVALFVYLGAFQEGAAARGRQFTAGYPVRAAMITDFRTLQHGETIRDAGNLLLTTSQHDFPVMHGSSVVGLLTRAALVRAMMNEGPEAYVAGAMARDFVRLKPDLPLAEALPQIAGPGACALVMDDEDRLLGMVTSENLSEFVLLRQAEVAPHRTHLA